MNKLHLPKLPSTPKLPKKVLLVLLGLLVVLVILIGAVAAYERGVDKQTARDQKAAQTAQKQSQDKDSQIATLKAQVSRTEAEKAVICSYVDQAQRTKLLAGKITIPVQANCPVSK